MYPNVEAEMARKKITRSGMAGYLNLNPNTMGKKLNGESDITLPEAIAIKKLLEVDMDLETLFDGL